MKDDEILAHQPFPSGLTGMTALLGTCTNRLGETHVTGQTLAGQRSRPSAPLNPQQRPLSTLPFAPELAGLAENPSREGLRTDYTNLTKQRCGGRMVL